MKVSIITLHRIYNYGSVLQAYATQIVFQKHGCQTEIIDYITPHRTFWKKLNTTANSISNNPIKRSLYRICKFVSLLLKEMTFGRFVNTHLRLTQKYISVNDLMNNPPKADVYVTGSDQTWNSTYNEGVDQGFFLNFLPSKATRIAFVSSFGKDKLDDCEKNITKQYLKRYKAISVREDCAIDILKDLGINNALQLIDPTLMINKKMWIRTASKRLIKEKYLILMLLYQEDNHATEYARKIADIKGLKLVKISWELKKPRLIDKLMTHRSPQDFLSLFYYSEFVVTNSFHGLAFSINLEKQFIVVPRKEYNSRIESLLRLCGLSDRMVNTFDEALSVSSQRINYVPIRSVLLKERQKADVFIDKALSGE